MIGFALLGGSAWLWQWMHTSFEQSRAALVAESAAFEPKLRAVKKEVEARTKQREQAAAERKLRRYFASLQAWNAHAKRLRERLAQEGGDDRVALRAQLERAETALECIDAGYEHVGAPPACTGNCEGSP